MTNLVVIATVNVRTAKMTAFVNKSNVNVSLCLTSPKNHTSFLIKTKPFGHQQCIHATFVA